MYRLLIADDEALEREGLEFIIQQMLPGTFQIIHAENGRVAIQRAEQHRPHIVLMDIKMPGIEGLEAIRQMKERNPGLKTVLVTAYDYFSYAQQAISLGVNEYILKPAKRELVANVLRKLLQELEMEENKREQSLERQEKLSQLMPLVESELAILLMSDAVLEIELEQAMSLLELQIDEGFAIAIVGEGDMDRRKVVYALKNYGRTMKTNFVSPMIGRHAAMFVTLEKNAEENPDTVALRIKLFLEEQFNIGFQTAAGSLEQGIEGLRRSYREALSALGGTGSLLKEEMEWNTQQLGQDREQMLRVIDRAKAWIKERYHQELSMEQAADYVNLNPFYFSKLFKKHVGETFIDYLTRLRIDKAKDLIGREELSLKEVCYEVGYNDPNYFSRVFKKVTGMSPTEHRSFVDRLKQGS
ncbi:MAG: yesN2 [Bacilli bacterium]|jgi:two-component system response regulator YesN|nr:yesN2 [Bacilli bacterium]